MKFIVKDLGSRSYCVIVFELSSLSSRGRGHYIIDVLNLKFEFNYKSLHMKNDSERWPCVSASISKHILWFINT